MKLVHVVPHINEEASGPSYSVPRLCQSLAMLGNEVELTCLAAAERSLDGVTIDLYPQWPVLRRLKSLAEIIGEPLSITLERVDHLPAGSSGKFRWIRSDISIYERPDLVSSS
jgi:hypothetical protein